MLSHPKEGNLHMGPLGMFHNITAYCLNIPTHPGEWVYLGYCGRLRWDDCYTSKVSVQLAITSHLQILRATNISKSCTSVFLSLYWLYCLHRKETPFSSSFIAANDNGHFSLLDSSIHCYLAHCPTDQNCKDAILMGHCRNYAFRQTLP